VQSTVTVRLQWRCALCHAWLEWVYGRL